MLLPGALLLCALTVYPLLLLLWMSFSTYQITAGGLQSAFAGLHNLETLAHDPGFLDSLKKTLAFVLGSVTLSFVLGLILAMLVHGGSTHPAIRTVLMLPMMVAPIAVGMIWRLIYNPEFGPLNRLLGVWGIAPVAWLAQPQLAMPSIILVDVWQWTAFNYLLLLAGLQTLPHEPFEAARVDGASEWQTFRYVTLPLLLPTIVLVLLFRTMDSFKAFDKLIVLTAGGPGTATEVLSLYIYKVSFRYWQLGYGALLALVAVLIIVVIARGYERGIHAVA